MKIKNKYIKKPETIVEEMTRKGYTVTSAAELVGRVNQLVDSNNLTDPNEENKKNLKDYNDIITQDPKTFLSTFADDRSILWICGLFQVGEVKENE